MKSLHSLLESDLRFEIQTAAIIEQIRQKYRARGDDGRADTPATEAAVPGWGGVTAVAAAAGFARHTVLAGLREVRAVSFA